MRSFWMFVAGCCVVPLALVALIAFSDWPKPAVETRVAQPCRDAEAMGVCLQGQFLTLARARGWAKPVAASECKRARNGHFVCRQFLMANDRPACFLLDVVRAPSGAPVELNALAAPLMACAKLAPTGAAS